MLGALVSLELRVVSLWQLMLTFSTPILLVTHRESGEGVFCLAASLSVIPNSFSHITAVGVIKSIHKISSDALGADGVPISVIKMSLPYLLPIIVHILDTSYSTHIFHHFGKSRLYALSPKFPLPLSPKIIVLYLFPALYQRCLRGLFIGRFRVILRRTGLAIPYNLVSVLTIPLRLRFSRSVKI